MKSVKQLTLLMMTALMIAFTACQEDLETLGRGDKTMTVRPGGPGDKVTPPGEVPYPKVIHRAYQGLPQFGNYRTQAYRLEWPEIAPGTDVEIIPSLFAASNGTLHSIKHIQKADPANKGNLSFSLYYDNMVATPYSVSEIWHWNEDYTAEKPSFFKYNLSLEHIQDWVTKRPSLFEYHYTHTKEAKSDEISYQQGDFFLMRLSDAKQYGGIRIVSEDPRIIEVYIVEKDS